MSDTDIDEMVERTRREIDTAPLCEPGPDQYVDACQWSRTGFAVYETDGRCTCRPTIAVTIRFSRCFAMPNAETFSVRPIGEFVQRFLAEAKVSVDPFARNRAWATHTNDINPSTSAQSHQDAEDFLADLERRGIVADLVLFDPPYSPRQVSEHYKAAGLTVTGDDTQNGRAYTAACAMLSTASPPLALSSYPSDGNLSAWVSIEATSYSKQCW